MGTAQHSDDNGNGKYERARLRGLGGPHLHVAAVQCSASTVSQLSSLRLMLVGVWLGLLWVLFYFFDHYIQSSLRNSKVNYLEYVFILL